MLHNSKYDKVKIAHKLSCLAWFIEKHGKQDAKNDNDKEFMDAMDSLQKDLIKHIAVFEKIMCK